MMPWWYGNIYTCSQTSVIMVALCNRADHYIFALWFLSIFFFLLFFSSPNLGGRRLDVYHTSTHDVALVRIRIQVWNLLHAARCKYRTQKSRQLECGPMPNVMVASSGSRQPNFAALNRGRHLCSAGRPSRWALAHMLVAFTTEKHTAHSRYNS